MKAVGLIVEYNPLHNGHLYHYQQAMKITQADASIAVMSGDFLQRGEPAVVSKWERTKMALAIGVDLVLELPVAYCTQNAEVFSFGAVSTLDSLGIVDSICFGSESGKIDWLDSLADQLTKEPQFFKNVLKEGLKTGLSYSKSYAAAISQFANVSEEVFQMPNNILGLNYMLALKRLNSPIKAFTIPRTKAEYNQKIILDSTIASATALRKTIAEDGLDSIKRFVPATTYSILQETAKRRRFPIDWDLFFPYVLYRLITDNTAELALVHEMEEGLEHRLKRFAFNGTDIHSFLGVIKTKRYTHNRIQRLLLYLLLNISKQEMRTYQLHRGVPYIRVLGFNKKGQALLQQARKKSKVPILSKISKEKHPMLELDIRSANLYERTNQSSTFRAEHTFHPIRWDLKN